MVWNLTNSHLNLLFIVFFSTYSFFLNFYVWFQAVAINEKIKNVKYRTIIMFLFLLIHILILWWTVNDYQEKSLY